MVARPQACASEWRRGQVASQTVQWRWRSRLGRGHARSAAPRRNPRPQRSSHLAVRVRRASRIASQSRKGAVRRSRPASDALTSGLIGHVSSLSAGLRHRQQARDLSALRGRRSSIPRSKSIGAGPRHGQEAESNRVTAGLGASVGATPVGLPRRPIWPQTGQEQAVGTRNSCWFEMQNLHRGIDGQF